VAVRLFDEAGRAIRTEPLDPRGDHRFERHLEGVKAGALYKLVLDGDETPDPYADLGELATGQKPGRGSEAERTLAINLGLAMDDMAIAPEIYRRAREKGIGTWLPL